MAGNDAPALLGRRSGTTARSAHGERIQMLSRTAFLQAVSNTALIAMDLLLIDSDGRVLLGLRKNAPARDYWFVPGGRIYKNEPMALAFRRITRAECGVEMRLHEARFAGVFEHFYHDNFAGIPGTGTHYVSLAYRATVAQGALALPDDQHRDYRWWTMDALLAAPEVHPYSKAYFAGATDLRAEASGNGYDELPCAVQTRVSQNKNGSFVIDGV